MSFFNAHRMSRRSFLGACIAVTSLSQGMGSTYAPSATIVDPDIPRSVGIEMSSVVVSAYSSLTGLGLVGGACLGS